MHWQRSTIFLFPSWIICWIDLQERGRTVILRVIKLIIRFLLHRKIKRKPILLVLVEPSRSRKCHLSYVTNRLCFWDVWCRYSLIWWRKLLSYLWMNFQWWWLLWEVFESFVRGSSEVWRLLPCTKFGKISLYGKGRYCIGSSHLREGNRGWSR